MVLYCTVLYSTVDETEHGNHIGRRVRSHYEYPKIVNTVFGVRKQMFFGFLWFFFGFGVALN